MSFGFYKLKTFLLFLACLFIGFALPFYPANAFVEWLGKVIIGGILWIVCMIPILLGAGLTSLAGNFLIEVTNPSFVTKRYIEIGFVKEGWSLCANLAGIFLVLALIAIGVAVALRMIKNPGEALIKFITAAVLIPFTPIIAGFMIDFANIFTFTFFRTGAAQGFLTGGNMLQSAVDAFSTMFAPGAGFLDGMASMLAALIFLALFGIMMGLTLFRFGIMLFARYVALWIIIILSPLAFCFLALSVIPSKEFPPFKFFSKLGEYHAMWWENLFGWSTIGILGSFFLYIAGMTANFLATTDSDLINSGWFYQLIGENLLPYIIPLFILYMGYNLTMAWAPAAAKQIVDGVEGAIKGVAKIGAAAVGGLAVGAAGSYAASEGGQALAAKMQTTGANMMEKPRQKTFGYALNRVGTSFGAFGQKAKKEMEDREEKQMANLAGIGDKGATLSRMKLPESTMFNKNVIDAQQKGKDKALLEQYNKEFDKGKIKTGDSRLLDMLGFASGSMDKATIEKLFKQNPELMQSKDIRSLQAQGLLTNAKTKDTMDFLSKDTLSKLTGLDDKQKGVAKDAMNPTKLLSEKDLDNAGITGDNKNKILQTRDSIIDLATKSAQRYIASTLKGGDTEKIDAKNFSDPATLQNLREKATPETLWSVIKRSGLSAFKDITTGMERSRMEALFRGLRPNDINDLDKDLLMSPEMMKMASEYGFAGKGGNQALISSILSNGNGGEIKSFLSMIKNNPRSARSFFSNLNDSTISSINPAVLDEVINSREMLEGMSFYGAKGVQKYLEVGGPEVVSQINEALNTDEEFRKTVITQNPGLIKNLSTQTASLAGVQIINPEYDPNQRKSDQYVNNKNASRYIEYYREQYKNQQTPESEPPPSPAQGPKQNIQQNIRQKVVNNPSPIASQNNQGQRIGGYQSLAQDIDDDENSDQGFARTKYE
jgi:hypothetical protein